MVIAIVQMVGKRPHVGWVVWLQAVIMFVLLLSPGDLYNAIPVFAAQAYLLITVLSGGSYGSIRTAVTITISSAVGAVVAAYAVAVSTSGAWQQARSWVHLGVMLAVAVLLTGSSLYVLENSPVQKHPANDGATVGN